MLNIHRAVAGLVGIVLGHVVIQIASKEPWYSQTIGGDIFGLLAEITLTVLIIGSFFGKSKVRKAWMFHLGLGAIGAGLSYIALIMSGLFSEHARNMFYLVNACVGFAYLAFLVLAFFLHKRNKSTHQVTIASRDSVRVSASNIWEQKCLTHLEKCGTAKAEELPNKHWKVELQGCVFPMHQLAEHEKKVAKHLTKEYPEYTFEVSIKKVE